jgi:hypothetical protein
MSRTEMARLTFPAYESMNARAKCNPLDVIIDQASTLCDSFIVSDHQTDDFWQYDSCKFFGRQF